MLLSDRITGPAIAALGAAAFYWGSRLPPVPGQQVGPSAFPMVVGAGLVLCGALIALGIGRTFEDEADAALAEHADAEQLAPLPGWRAWLALLPPLLVVFYALVSERLGFLPTTAIMVAATGFAFGASWRLVLPVAAVAPLVINTIFLKLLRVPLPGGLLPLPW